MDSQITSQVGVDSGGAVRCTDWLDVRRTHLDLFSGIGGFALAANAAGYKTIGFSEIEPYACKILKRHWPDVPNYGDIRNIRGVRADLITGGFPCQPFSSSGHKRGKEDDRHLWPEMCRVIDEARPAWVLAENVPGIVAMELDSVLSDLEGIGYACWPLIIPALAVDARHRRDRVWIVANSAGVGRKEATERREPSIPMPQLGCENGIWHEWPTEPELGRVANGIPNRAHRIQGLGNAIVPKVAEVMLREMARMTANDRTERQPPGEAAACNQTSQETKSADTGKRGGCSLQ